MVVKVEAPLQFAYLRNSRMADYFNWERVSCLEEVAKKKMAED